MTVFNKTYADQYDHFYAGKDYALETNLIDQAVARFGPAPKSVLDVGCGTGKHAIELARRGYRVAGVDLSPSMLEHAAENAAGLPAQSHPRWVQGDVRTFEVDESFDMAIMMFAVVGYLTTNEDVLAGLRNIRRHVKPGGLFICDFWYGPAVLATRPSDRIRSLTVGDSQVIRATTTTLDTFRQTADVAFRVWRISAGGKLDEAAETHRQRYFFPQEFALFLSQAGFKLESLSAFPTLDSPLTDDTWNAFAVSRAV